MVCIQIYALKHRAYTPSARQALGVQALCLTLVG